MIDVLSGEIVSSGPFIAKKHRVYAIHSKEHERKEPQFTQMDRN